MSKVDKDIVHITNPKQNQTSSYRSIFKATSLFGGVQAYQILIGVVKSKFIAVLLGPTGMGVLGLYQSTLDLIRSLTAFGLENSAVRDISEANSTGDLKLLARIVATVQRLVWLTGLFGFVVTLFLSNFLSQLTFGNGDYTWAFAILSSTLLINQLCAGQKVVLQGMRRLKNLAKASAIGSTIGLLASVPLYYWIGVNGIVPTIVIIAVSAMLVSWFYSRRIPIEKQKVSMKQAFAAGQSMLKMGMAMSISSILVTASAYALRWFIRLQGGVDEVGLFTAGFVIVNTYVGMVFTAMSTDYYPRLAAVNKNNERCKEIVNQQGEIAILILAPIIVSCVIFMPLIIRIIYSETFLPAFKYIVFAVTGILFKAASWVISYYFLAKAESKLFVINEVLANIYFLVFNLFGYYWGGLSGLGMSYALGYLVYLIQVYTIAKRKYGFCFSSSFMRNFGILVIMVMASMLTTFFLHNSAFAYCLTLLILIVCSYYCIYELNNKINLYQFVKEKIYKK